MDAEARPARPLPAQTGLLVPLYIYPAQGEGRWLPLIAAKRANPNVRVLAIVNPGSGPGTIIDPNYVTGISDLRSAGIQILAYVSSQYGRRAYVAVAHDIDEYLRLYGRNFDGVFIDEMAKTEADHYGEVASHARQSGFGLVVGNPGTDVPSGYVGRAADVFVIYENSGYPSLAFLDGWHSSHPKTTWAFIAHHASSLDPGLVRGAKDRVGLLYLTDLSYEAFPPYLLQLVALL